MFATATATGTPSCRLHDGWCHFHCFQIKAMSSSSTSLLAQNLWLRNSIWKPTLSGTTDDLRRSNKGGDDSSSLHDGCIFGMVWRNKAVKETRLKIEQSTLGPRKMLTCACILLTLKRKDTELNVRLSVYFRNIFPIKHQWLCVQCTNSRIRESMTVKW